MLGIAPSIAQEQPRTGWVTLSAKAPSLAEALEALRRDTSVTPKNLTVRNGETLTSLLARLGVVDRQVERYIRSQAILRPRVHVKHAKGLFPGDSAIAVETDDAGVTRFWGPIFHVCARLFQRTHLLQNGSLHFYVLLMIIAVAALLIWGALS